MSAQFCPPQDAGEHPKPARPNTSAHRRARSFRQLPARALPRPRGEDADAGSRANKSGTAPTVARTNFDVSGMALSETNPGIRVTPSNKRNPCEAWTDLRYEIMLQFRPRASEKSQTPTPLVQGFDPV